MRVGNIQGEAFKIEIRLSDSKHKGNRFLTEKLAVIRPSCHAKWGLLFHKSLVNEEVIVGIYLKMS
jgi:hypothetical protein